MPTATNNVYDGIDRLARLAPTLADDVQRLIDATASGQRRDELVLSLLGFQNAVLSLRDQAEVAIHQYEAADHASETFRKRAELAEAALARATEVAHAHRNRRMVLLVMAAALTIAPTFISTLQALGL